MTAKLDPALRDNPLLLTQRAALALGARTRRALRDKGINDVNPAQLSILAVLEANDGTTATEVARHVLYEKSTLTPLLDKLEDAGLLLRARDPKDGRVQRLFITKKGRKRRRDADHAVAAVMSTMLSTLPKKVLKHHVEFCKTVLAALASDEEATA